MTLNLNMKEPVASLSRYMEIISNIQKAEEHPDLLRSTDDMLIFRGVHDYAYKLMPGIFRKQKYKELGDEEAEMYTHLSFEKEKSMLLSFIGEASCYVNIPKEDFFLWATYAQHFGVPTRFLDWTSSPLVALHFACKNRVEEDGAVWLLSISRYLTFRLKTSLANPNLKKQDVYSRLLDEAIISENILSLDDISLQLPFLHKPLYFDARMSAQSSYFMVWGVNKQPLEELLSEKFCEDIELLHNIKINPLEQHLSDVLFKIKIPASSKRNLLCELDLVGINEKSLFPGLDGIGKYIERRYRIDFNEEFLMDKKSIPRRMYRRNSKSTNRRKKYSKS